MRRCSESRALVPLIAILPRTSSPPALFPASSLACPLMRLAGSFTAPPRAVSSSLDVTFDESVPFYRLFPYRSAPPPPTPLFLAHGPPPVDPLPGTVPVEVAIYSGAARGAASGGAASGGAEPGGAESQGARSGGAELGGAEPTGVESGGAEPEGVGPRGVESQGAESGGAEPRGVASSRGSVGALPRLSP
ncbi:unnamed protein product [Closterium sp. NIES-54]